MTDTETKTSFDPNRQLCPDGACVGVLGPDGRCTVCVRTEAAAAAGVELAEVPASAGQAGGDTGGFDPERRLCDDGSCVGVVGPDGACGVCGRKAE
jgi:hypothetical protein